MRLIICTLIGLAIGMVTTVLTRLRRDLVQNLIVGTLEAVGAIVLTDVLGLSGHLGMTVISGLWGFVYFGMLDTKVPWLIFLGVALSLVPIMNLYGPQAALIAESFSPRLRYSGTSLGYQLASIIAGGPSPFIATWLFATYHSSLPIAFYIMVCGVIGFVAAAMLTDYTNKEISEEYAGV